MKYKMTYNNKNMHGCSARGIALRDTKEELQDLKEQLKDSIYNAKIFKNDVSPEPDKACTIFSTENNQPDET